jgi:nicotinamidase-related amidase
MKYEFVLVDLQNDFATEGGKFYSPKPSVNFLNETLFPFLKEKGVQINEIVSDYRQPRPGDRGDCCHPGSWGYESLLPSELRKSLWIKCMNSPIWVRENIGIVDKEPGLPYQDIEGFTRWLDENIGLPKDVTPILIGLTIDCCVLSTAQELSWRGYSPIVLSEGVDHASGKLEDKDKIFETPLTNWADVINWSDLKNRI